MKNKAIKSLSLLVVAAGLLASCGNEKPTQSTEEPSSSAADTTKSEEEQLVAPDKSNLKYVSSIDKYKKTDWKASWIWDEKSIQNSYVAFRKTFTLSETPTSAIAHISAVTKYYMWVNGELAIYDGSPKRGATPVDGFYEDADLAQYLKKGDNTIVALVTYVGASSNSYVDPGKAGFLFEMDAGSTKVISDTTWKEKRLKEFKNQSLLKDDWPNHPSSSYTSEWDVYYDARESNGDYTNPSFDDSSWSNAVITGKVGYLPYGDTYFSDSPINKFSKEIIDCVDTDGVIGKKITEATTVHFDIGENKQFSPYFKIEAEAGAHLLYYSNTYETDNGIAHNFIDDYIAKDGVQEFESYPWRTGSQIIIDVPAGVTILEVGYRDNGYPVERTAKFVSDNADANQLWNEARNTVQICMRDSYMDCPDRERSPYSGDSANQFAFAHYAFGPSAETLSKKTLRSLPGWVEQDDIIPSRWPSAANNEITIQDLAFIGSFEDYYNWTSDAESLELVYPIALNYLKLWNMEDNGLPEKRLGTFKWIDWGTTPDANPLYDEFYYIACEDMLYLANKLGHTEDVSFLEGRMNSIKTNFAKVYKTDKGYVSSDTRSPDERVSALGILTGLIPTEDWEQATDIMENTYTASTYMERYVLEALCYEGEYDIATSRMVKRYEPMLEDDMTTLWEQWGINGSFNHGWSGAPILLCSKYVAGIQPKDANFSTYEIAPNDTLGNLETVTCTEKGNISMKVVTEGDTTTITLDTIEANGTIKIDSCYGENITVDEGDSALVDGTASDYKAYSLNKGHYVFTVK